MAALEPRSISRVSPTVARARHHSHDDQSQDDQSQDDERHDDESGGLESAGLESGDVALAGGSRSPGWLTEDARESALTPYLPERWRGARVSPERSGVLALAAVGTIVVLLAGFFVMRDSPEALPVPALPVVQPLSGQSVQAVTTSAPEPPTTIVVSVVGLVVVSGLVHLPAGSRVADALAAAGGARDGADVLALNLAARVEDGSQIVVGSVPPEGRPVVSSTVADSGAAGASDGPAPAAKEPGSKVDLNAATAAELDALPGVGPVTAASIVSWRETSGPFTDVAQLAEVDGIGPVRLEKLRDQVTV